MLKLLALLSVALAVTMVQGNDREVHVEPRHGGGPHDPSGYRSQQNGFRGDGGYRQHNGHGGSGGYRHGGSGGYRRPYGHGGPSYHGHGGQGGCQKPGSTTGSSPAPTSPAPSDAPTESTSSTTGGIIFVPGSPTAAEVPAEK